MSGYSFARKDQKWAPQKTYAPVIIIAFDEEGVSLNSQSLASTPPRSDYDFAERWLLATGTLIS
jgi:hypothetical protein